MIKQWSVGFLFRMEKTGQEVALILKDHPAWHTGKLNGIGGHVEKNEDRLLAMFREFEEETGFGDYDWRRFCSYYCSMGVIHFYMAHSFDAVLKSVTDEPVNWFNVDEVLKDPRLIPNLKWLIPMALDKDNVVAMVEEGSFYAEKWTRRELEIARSKRSHP